jgi:hypothetical protein
MRIFGFKRVQVRGERENCITKRFIIFAVYFLPNITGVNRRKGTNNQSEDLKRRVQLRSTNIIEPSSK